MKKILNILVSISLIATGSTAVVACGSNPSPSSNDQQLVNDVINKIKDKSFAVNEDNQGDLNFGSYSQQVLKEVRKPLANDEQNLVHFAKSENPTPISAEKITNINLHVQSHKIYQDIDIPVKLNYDAQSIANKINAQKIITVSQKVYKQFEPANNYTKAIKSQINNLLIPSEQQSGYQISGWENANIYWPYWNKTTGKEVDPNVLIPLNIQIGQNKAQAKITLEFQYYEQKKVLDDPRNGEKQNALLADLGGNPTLKPSQWGSDIPNDLNFDWEALGGLTPSLYSDVVYEPVTLKEGVPVLVKMYFKDGILGYTKNNPLSFYVKGN